MPSATRSIGNITARNAAFDAAEGAGPRETGDIGRPGAFRPMFAYFTRADGRSSALRRMIFILWISGDKWISRG